MSNKPTVLVIDDDPDIGAMFKMLLEFNGYNTVVTENAEKAEAIAKAGTIDLIIMDMLLSGVNGTDICASFKKDEAISKIPLIMMSAHPDAKTICLHAGADDFISKPFDVKDVFLKLNHFLKNDQT